MNDGDKANIFGIITCSLIAFAWDIGLFYNISIGFAIGSFFWYSLACFKKW